MPWKILVVESGLDTATALQASRELAEMEVLGLGAPDDALLRLSQVEFHVLVIDLDDPKVTGLLLLEHASKLYPAMQRIALATSGPLAGMLTEGETPLAHHVVPKPVDRGRLARLVGEAARSGH